MAMSLSLEVGKTYLNRKDEKVCITAISSSGNYPYRSSINYTYTLAGMYVIGEEHPDDLISECSPERLLDPLLDQFAIVALPVFIELGMSPAGAAAHSYDYAEAMMTEREKRK
jgi:hypothetical protein